MSHEQHKVEVRPAPLLQDALTMAAKRLGEAKTEATIRGTNMLDSFEKIRRESAALKTHGLSITAVEFEDRALQAAWLTYNTENITEMPLMPTELEIEKRIRSA